MFFEWVSDAFRFDKKKMAVTATLGPFAYPLILGQLIKNLALTAVGTAYDTQLSPIQSIPDRLQRSIGRIRKLLATSKDPTKDIQMTDVFKALDDMADAAGYIGGIPTEYGTQVAQAAIRAKTGEKPDTYRGKERVGWRASPWAELIWSPSALSQKKEKKGKNYSPYSKNF